MPTIIYAQTFDVDDGAPDDASHWSRVTTTVHTGAGALRLNPTASVGYWNKNAAVAVRTIVMQAYIRFATRPTVNLQNIFGSFVPTQADIGLGWVAATNQFACTCGDVGPAGGPTILANTWYKLDLKMVTTGATYTTDAKVNDVALTQRTFAAVAHDMSLYQLGTFSEASTADYFFDDLQVSNTAADFPIAVNTAPSAPLNPIATPGNAQVALTWSAPASNGGSAVTAYKIYRSLTTNTETLLASPAGTGTAYTDATAANGTLYFYKISAVNAIGESALSNEVSATPGASAPSVTQSLVATAGNAQVALTWVAPASNGGSAITGYRIYRGTAPDGEVPLALPAGTGTSYTDSTAVNGTLYYYRVSALNAIGEGTWSNEANATPTLPAARLFKRLYGPSLLGNTATTLYTCPASTIAVIRHVHVSNPSGSTVDFTLSIGTNAAGTRLWDGYPIPVDDVLDHYQDFSLAAGEIIQAVAGVGATLNLTLDGYEVGAGGGGPPPPIYPSDTLFPSDTSP